jgi:hypothetical protein
LIAVLTGRLFMQLVVEELKDNVNVPEEAQLWAECLTDGTWPEILRRVAVLNQDIIPKAGMEAAQHLGSTSFEDLSAMDQLLVLSTLCDQVLDTHKLREELQNRFEFMKQVCTALVQRLFALCNCGRPQMCRPACSGRSGWLTLEDVVLQAGKDLSDALAEVRRKHRDVQDVERSVRKNKTSLQAQLAELRGRQQQAEQPLPAAQQQSAPGGTTEGGPIDNTARCAGKCKTDK